MRRTDTEHGGLKRAAVLAMVGVAAWAVVGCGEEARAPADDKPTIAVTIYPIASLVEQLVGESAEVVCLLPAGQSPHHAALTSNKRAALGRADVIVAVGLGLDGWVDSARAGGRAEPATVLRCGALLGMTDGASASDHDHDHGHDHEHDHDHDHEHGADGDGDDTVDPHVWTDPVLATALVIELSNRLQPALPARAGVIAARGEALVGQLRALDGAYRRRLEPYRGAALVTYHSAFNRLADRYGLVVAATLAPVETPGAMTAAARRRAKIVIERHGLRAIFAEPQFPPAAAETIKREMGVEIVTLDPLGDPNDPDRATYQAMMRYNLDQLVRGLRRNAETD